MKQSRGEAAFESVDEVLAEKIVHTSRNRAKSPSDRTAPSSPSRSADAPSPDNPAAVKKKNGMRLIIGMCAGILLLVMGIMCFNRCKDKRT
ncbi:MAG: hypothetical protein JW768_16025 [Chitinispirillaceae bacterium]|nr:hypothetical protein [Chitinispirillaceae bacterium]